eukprot:TRINITY_DN1488_c0_g1_i2.p1 TRINITY_DN1488_c0_g1~~TRINITY_DN1488_c0_g1_i2.p1  ORF type:complete len:116 (-),score=21.44 TRINITY_DN1488_c0_g1_i2:287-634(-)
MDGILNGSKCDPYVVVTAIKELNITTRRETTVKPKTMTPRWDETLQFKNILVDRPIKVELLDKDKNASETVGHTQFFLKNFFATEQEMEHDDYDEDTPIEREGYFRIVTKKPKRC